MTAHANRLSKGVQARQPRGLICRLSDPTPATVLASCGYLPHTCGCVQYIAVIDYRARCYMLHLTSLPKEHSDELKPPEAAKHILTTYRGGSANEECRKHLVQASGACSCVNPASTGIDKDGAKFGIIEFRATCACSTCPPTFPVVAITIVCTVDGREICTPVVGLSHHHDCSASKLAGRVRQISNWRRTCNTHRHCDKCYILCNQACRRRG